MKHVRDLQSSIKSKIITFVVGNVKFPVHVDVVLGKCETLDRVLKQDAKVTSDVDVAMFSEHDPDTFSHFISFCYTGDYVAPSESKLVADDDDDDDDDKSPELSFSNYYELLHQCIDATDPFLKEFTCAVCGRLNHPEDDTLFPFCSISCAIPTSREPAKSYCVKCGDETAQIPDLCDGCKAWIPRALGCLAQFPWYGTRVHLEERRYLAIAYPGSEQSHACESCRPLHGSDRLMSHVALYHFAQTFNIPELVKKCLFKLALDLSRYRMHPDNTKDIVRLIRTSYDSTSRGDVLRKFMAKFAVSHMHMLLRGTISFESLPQDLPDFGVDLMHAYVDNTRVQHRYTIQLSMDEMVV